MSMCKCILGMMIEIHALGFPLGCILKMQTDVLFSQACHENIIKIKQKQQLFWNCLGVNGEKMSLDKQVNLLNTAI